MSEKQKQEYNNPQSDMWNEYLSERNKAEEDSKPAEPKAGISPQVERDLLEYKKTQGKNKNSIFIILMIGFIVFASLVAITFTNVAINHSQQPEEIVEVYEDDDYEYEEYGNPFETPMFSYWNTNYQLPTPMSQLLSNGWVLEDVNEDDVVNKDEVKEFVITNEEDDYSIKVFATSLNQDECKLKDSTVIGVELNDYGWVDLPGAMFMNMSSYSIEDTFKDYDVSFTKTGKGDESEYTLQYEVDNGTDYKYYTLTFDLEDDMLEKVTMKLDKAE